MIPVSVVGRPPAPAPDVSVGYPELRRDVQQLGTEIWTNPTRVVTSGDSGY